MEPLKKNRIHAKAKDASDIKEVQEIFLQILEEEFQEHKIYEEEYPGALVSKKL